MTSHLQGRDSVVIHMHALRTGSIHSSVSMRVRRAAVKAAAAAALATVISKMRMAQTFAGMLSVRLNAGSAVPWVVAAVRVPVRPGQARLSHRIQRCA